MALNPLLGGGDQDENPTLATDTLAEIARQKAEKKKRRGKKQKQATGEVTAEETPPVQKSKTSATKSTVSGVATGAIGGGLTGGPVGALVGGALGAIGGIADADAAKQEDPNRPKRRRLTKALEAREKAKSDKERRLATLSQAVFDWAASIR